MSRYPIKRDPDDVQTNGLSYYSRPMHWAWNAAFWVITGVVFGVAFVTAALS